MSTTSISSWERRRVPLKFRLGERTLFAPALLLQVREVTLTDETCPVAVPQPPEDPLAPDCAGFLIRSLPVETRQPAIRRLPRYLCYVPSQYRRYYADLRQPFATYQQKFSAKTRSTISRKIKRFAAQSGGRLRWKVYKGPNEIQEFYRLARVVSAKTYQEKLLAAGLPETREFVGEMVGLAVEDRVRGYLLFDGERPVAYLYCPITRRVLLYQYLGYDPEYVTWSVGTILQWCAIEDMCREETFSVLDFTEGESQQKRQFATDSVPCANVYFLRPSVRNTLLVYAHWLMDSLSAGIGDRLDRWGLKARIKRLIRFGK